MGRRWLVVLALVPAVAASGATPQRPRTGGTVVVAADQEPPHLNPFIAGGDHLYARIPHLITMAGAFRVTPRWTYEPDLVARASVRRRGGGMVVTYVIDKRARWSDGVPINAEDFRFTWQVNVDPRYRDFAPAGYRAISNVTGGRAKTVVVTFARALAGWRDLFAEVLPAHALAGVDLATAWQSAIDDPNTGKPIASGPFYLAEWRKGCCMIFRRNPRYWKRRPYLDSVVLEFEGDINKQAQQVMRGRLDVVSTFIENACFYGVCDRDGVSPPANLRVEIGPSATAENLYFNVGFGKGPLNALLRQAWVRRAIAYALDRRELSTKSFWRGSHLPVLDSAIIPRASRYYRRHWAKYRYSAVKARQIMTAHGCRRGSDGIFSCGGQRASFLWMGTSGGQRRELNFEIVRPRLAAAGIEIRPDFPDPATAFGRRLPEGDYDVANFATASTPDLSGWDAIYGCAGRQGYCNRRVTAWLEAASREPSHARQAALVNKALAQLARDVVVLPLYELPTVTIRNRRVHGVAGNGQDAGIFWNVARWWRARR